MGKVVLVSCYEVVDAGGDGGREDRCVFGHERDMRRDEAYVGVANNLCSCEKTLETSVVTVKSEMSRNLTNGITRSHGGDVAETPELQEPGVVVERGRK